MYQEERLREIMQWLKEEDILSNQDLVERFGISRDTARRDIVKLTEAGQVVRTHGGIACPDFRIQVDNYQTRMMQNMEGKKRIGKEAAKMLPREGNLFFDVSTHMQFVCSQVSSATKVYTHSIDNVEFMAKMSSSKIHCLGGTFHRENRFFYGYDVWKTLSNMRFDTALLGVAAMGEDGIYFEDEEDAQIKRLAAERAESVIVMADYSKFQRVSKFRAIGFDKIDRIITDRALSSQWEERFEKEDVQWITV